MAGRSLPVQDPRVLSASRGGDLVTNQVFEEPRQTHEQVTKRKGSRKVSLRKIGASTMIRTRDLLITNHSRKPLVTLHTAGSSWNVAEIRPISRALRKHILRRKPLVSKVQIPKEVLKPETDRLDLERFYFSRQ